MNSWEYLIHVHCTFIGMYTCMSQVVNLCFAVGQEWHVRPSQGSGVYKEMLN